MNCSGYYRYDEGYTPEFAGIEDFAGTVIHPQHWPEEPDYAGKRVVVIGSGATAVTLVPAMAEDAAHVTMLQRSPTYIVSVPGEDPIAELLRKVLPDRAVYPIVRWKNVALQSFTYRLARSRPRLVKKLLRKGLDQRAAGGLRRRHPLQAAATTPGTSASAWSPTATSSRSLSDGSAEIVTDRIERFTPAGIKLESGRELEADVVVTATGLNLLFLGGMRLEVDGEELDQGEILAYKGMMLGDVPNLAFTIGYTNASWTLKADLVAEYVCRLLNHMDADGYDVCAPHLSDPSVSAEPIMDFTSGYVLRVDRRPAEAGLEGAVETAPELRGRPAGAALRLARGRRDAVLAAGPRRPGRRLSERRPARAAG